LTESGLGAEEPSTDVEAVTERLLRGAARKHSNPVSPSPKEPSTVLTVWTSPEEPSTVSTVSTNPEVALLASRV